MNRRWRSKPPSPIPRTETLILLQSLLVAAPSLGLLIYFWTVTGASTQTRWIVGLICITWTVVTAVLVRRKFQYHLQALSNLVEAIRKKDYSLRSSRSQETGALGDLCRQINLLLDQLQASHRGEEELRSLLSKVVAQINVAIVACDSRHRIRMINPSAAKLLGGETQDFIDKNLDDTALSVLNYSERPQLIEHGFPGGEGRWQVVWQQYRYRGQPGRLLFVTDLQQVLSAEESRAWQRLIRVITHEINNSLTPISSITQTLLGDFSEDNDNPDLITGLQLIGERSEHLASFVREYASLAKLPTPQRKLFSLTAMLQRLGQLFEGQKVTVQAAEAAIEIYADPAQIEQLLINLVRNGIEASSDKIAVVTLSYSVEAEICEITIADEGRGISNPSNLFVPFYSTKNKGSGIGLVLCRQIAEAHGGVLSLKNRPDGKGAIATVSLPLSKTI